MGDCVSRKAIRGADIAGEVCVMKNKEMSLHVVCVSASLRLK